MIITNRTQRKINLKKMFSLWLTVRYITQEINMGEVEVPEQMPVIMNIAAIGKTAHCHSGIHFPHVSSNW